MPIVAMRDEFGIVGGFDERFGVRRRTEARWLVVLL